VGKLVTVSIKVDEDLLKVIDSVCGSLRINRSEFFRSAARHMLADLGVDYRNDVRVKYMRVS